MLLARADLYEHCVGDIPGMKMHAKKHIKIAAGENMRFDQRKTLGVGGEGGGCRAFIGTPGQMKIKTRLNSASAPRGRAVLGSRP